MHSLIHYSLKHQVELQLRRHSKDSSKDNYRIDDLLDRKAKEGVKIYIIV